MGSNTTNRLKKESQKDYMWATFKAKSPQYKCRHHCQSHMVLYNSLKY